MIRELLTRERRSLGELDGIAFGAGPGSFTGLRIACGVAQGLALGAGLRVVGVCTLEAMAEAARQRLGATRVVAALDARMGEVYAAHYRHDGERWTAETEPAASKPGAVYVPPGRDWLGVGPGFAAYAELRSRLASALSACRDDLLPSAAAVGALALPRFAAGGSVAASAAAPLYLRNRVALTVAERAAGMRL